LAFLFFAATACERVNAVIFDELIMGASDTKNPFKVSLVGQRKAISDRSTLVGREKESEPGRTAGEVRTGLPARWITCYRLGSLSLIGFEFSRISFRVTLPIQGLCMRSGLQKKDKLIVYTMPLVFSSLDADWEMTRQHLWDIYT
jgi:hypothetical protein